MLSLALSLVSGFALSGFAPALPTQRSGARPRAAVVASAAALTSAHFTELQNKGFTVVPNFLEPTAVEALRTDVSQLSKEGRFATAGVGESGTNRVDGLVRRCEQCFLFPQFKHKGGGHEPGRATVYSTLDSIRSELDKHCGVPLDGLLTEGLYASYPNGGFYRRHVDAVASTASTQRQWSYLLYLNPEWQEEHGGCLRIHTDGGGELAPPGAAPSFVDVAPRAGTLVLFRSTMPHEVLNTEAARLAVAGWFNKPVEGSSARRSLIAALAAAVAIGGAAKLVTGMLSPKK